jgi:1-acyl-sn-glycerol-3-phosphate acyltransferase
MEGFDLERGTYRTPERRLSRFARWFPSLRHYARFLPIVIRCARAAKRGVYDDAAWAESSHDVRHSLEAAGVKIAADGLDHVARLSGPCVFISNHMSMLETMVLPGFVQPLRPVTFVVKESLVHYPVFKHVMRSRDPIVVTRKDPRADLKAMLQGGARRLCENRSIIVFPQTTRTTVFDRNEFNSIGVKMAARSGVPVVPIALRTDAWGNRKRGLKDFGKIDPRIPVHFAFGAPIEVTGRGAEAQERVVAFIEEHLSAWGLPPGKGSKAVRQ